MRCETPCEADCGPRRPEPPPQAGRFVRRCQSPETIWRFSKKTLFCRVLTLKVAPTMTLMIRATSALGVNQYTGYNRKMLEAEWKSLSKKKNVRHMRISNWNLRPQWEVLEHCFESFGCSEVSLNWAQIICNPSELESFWIGSNISLKEISKFSQSDLDSPGWSWNSQWRLA